MAGMRRLPVEISIGLIVLLLFGCQSPRKATSAWLALDDPAWVHFPLLTDSQQYAFSASPDTPTVLTFASLSPGLAYTAEVRDGRGTLVATFNGSLPGAALTISPGSDVYQVTVKPGGSSAGALALTASTRQSSPPATAPNFDPGQPVFAETSPFQPAALLVPGYASCRAASGGANVNVRSGPGLEHRIIGTLLAGSTMETTGRSVNDWYRVSGSGAAGWVSGSVVSLSGACDTLPVIAPETEPFQVLVDRRTWGSFSDSLAADDPVDLLQVIVTNFLPQPPDNYGEFTLTLTCDGQDKQYVRWGSPDSQNFPCDSAIVLPFMAGSNRQSFAIALPAAVTSPVRYHLVVARR
ncbi:MAG: SH3 domain-containing protein [Chloroflexi bacterium]|nr:SH3 domain-containing protein [Chloroflexota bacterium]